MNKRHFVRWTALALTLSLLLSLTSMAAFAENTDTVNNSTPTTPLEGMPPDGLAPDGTAPGYAGMEATAITELENRNTSTHFGDLSSGTAWANAYIDWLFEQGITTGTAEGVYSPKKTVSRAELAVMLYRNYAYATEGFSYGDVATDTWYYQAVMRGKASGVFEADTYFLPTEAVTREQAAIWIYNSEVYKGMPTDMNSNDVSSYTDATSISENAKTAVATLTSLGIFKGDSNNNFNPSNSLTRAELAVIFYRLSFMGGGTSGGEASATIDHGTYATLAEADATGTTYASTGDQENALRVEGDTTLTLTDITVSKTAGEAGTGDTSNFYGVNAGVLALDGATLTINGATVTTTATGANGIFSYGEGTTVTVNNAAITTSENSSGGVMVTGGGTMHVNNSTVATQGGSSAALRTDRGGGTLVVNGGTYVSNGNGSPAIYSTAAVTASNATLTATTSEAIVVEGKNSVTLIDCDVSGNMIKDNVENLQNVMIYQSMSGDADSGTSSFSMTGGSLTSKNGDMIYVTNTACTISLSDVSMTYFNDVLLRVVGNDARNGWGVVGSNGGQAVFTANDQDLSGKIIVDSISSLDFSMIAGSNFYGSINSGNEGGEVNVTLDDTCYWQLTGNTYVTSLSGATDNIDLNGFTLYVNGVAMP